MKKVKKWAAAALCLPLMLSANWAEVTSFVEGAGDGNLSFGYSVDAGGDYLIVGAPDENGSYGPHDGAAYVFKKDVDGQWMPVDKIEGYFNASLGKDVAIKDYGADGVYAAVGMPDYEFYDGKTGTTEYRDVVQVLALSTPGNFRTMRTFYDINGTGLGSNVDIVGFTQTSGIPPNVHLDDKGVIVVAGEPNYSTADGRVVSYAFSFMDGTTDWKSFTLSDTGAIYNHFGHAVAATDDLKGIFTYNGRAHLAVGAPDEDVQDDQSNTYTDKGAVYVYELNGTFSSGFSWSKEERLTQDVNGVLLPSIHYTEGSHFGTAVDLTQWQLVAGALMENIASNYFLGHYIGEADVFSLRDVVANSWEYNSSFVQPENPDIMGSERFGAAVAIDTNNRVVVGAPAFNDTGAVFVYGYDNETHDWIDEGSFTGRSAGALGTAVDLADGQVVAGDPENDKTGIYEWREMDVNPALLMYLLN